MALTDCNLITGQTLDCRDSQGGILECYITEFQNINSFTETSGTITAISRVSGKQYWRFEFVRETAQFTQTQTGSLENGTNFYEQSFTMVLHKRNAQKRNQLKLMALNRLSIIIKDANGLYWLLGQSFAMDLLNTVEDSGKAIGDLNGMTLTFTGREPYPACAVSSSIITALLTP